MPPRVVGKWLLGCAGLVYGALAGGGFVRRTDSAVSIVEWRLIPGIIPPLSQAQWQDEFNRYKSYPIFKFKSESRDGEMSLGEFKSGYMLEYLHRMWGRAIGVVFFVPCVYFWYKGHFSQAMKGKMLLAGSLIVSQGLIGWWMVQSGLDPSQNTNSNIPRVSQYRLTAHFSMATALYSLFLYTGLSNLLTHYDYSQVPQISKLRGLTLGCKVLIFTTVIMGVFVAGLNAGTVCNTWPKFDGHWIPQNILAKHPKWKNLFENQVTVQFVHRNLAYLTFSMVALTWFVGCRMPLHRRTRFALHGLMVTVCMQLSSGLSTLLSQTNHFFAALHQNESLLLISSVLWLCNELRKVIK